MFEALAKILAAYFLGGVMGGDLMRRMLGGGDLRSTGSGNVGATNALRTRGPLFAVGVLFIDVGKGVVAALLIPRLLWPGQAGSIPLAWLQYLCAAAVAVGHCYPLLQKFRGGKGVATLAGVFGALFPAALPWILICFVLVVLVSGYAALASIGGAITGVVYVVGFAERPLSIATLFSVAMLLLVTFKHRGNLINLCAGTEYRFEKARLIGKQMDRWRGH